MPRGWIVLLVFPALSPSTVAAQGIGLGQLQVGLAAPNSAYGGGVAFGGRGALGFRAGAWVFGVDGGVYGLGDGADLATLGGFARVGRRNAAGLYGIGELGYQGPGYPGGGGASLFGVSLGAGWSPGSSGRSGWSVQGSYLLRLQRDEESPTSTALVFTVGREWRW